MDKIRCSCGNEFKDDANMWAKNAQPAEDKFNSHIRTVARRHGHFIRAHVSDVRRRAKGEALG